MIHERQEAARERVKEAYALDPDQIIGTLASHLSVDLYQVFPENDILRRAHERGVSHWIRNLTQKERTIPQANGLAPVIEVTTEVPMEVP